jgi:hydroxymethylbilane synthase
MTQHALETAHPGLQVKQRVFTTRGDLKLDISLAKGDGGGKGLFTKELEDALLSGEIDVAVHSLKDLPGHQPEGLQLTAVLERAPIGDVLITREPHTLDSLPIRSHVGTSSVRRARQVLWLRPDITVEEWRGNVPTRLRKFRERSELEAIILAEAGLRRLGYGFEDGRLRTEEGEFFAASLLEQLLPAIGQGAIGLQTRAGDEAVEALLFAVNHETTWLCIRAERELQRLLAGDCSLPVGVRTVRQHDKLSMSAILFGDEGKPPLRAEATGSVAQPENLAVELFRRLS